MTKPEKPDDIFRSLAALERRIKQLESGRVGSVALNSVKFLGPNEQSGFVMGPMQEDGKLQMGPMTAMPDGSIPGEKLQSDSIYYDKIHYETVTVDRMAIAHFDNMLSDPGFERVTHKRDHVHEDSVGWSRSASAPDQPPDTNEQSTTQAGWYTFTDKEELMGVDADGNPVVVQAEEFRARTGKRCARHDGHVDDQASYYINRARVDIIPDEELALEFWISAESPDGECGVDIYHFNAYDEFIRRDRIQVTSITGPFERRFQSFVPPVGGSYAICALYVLSHTTGSWFIDDVILKHRILEDDIGDEAVTDVKIASMTVGKLTAGNLSAEVILSGNIKTSDTGQRVEINSSGLEVYRSDESKAISLTSGSLEYLPTTDEFSSLQGVNWRRPLDADVFFHILGYRRVIGIDERCEVYMQLFDMGLSDNASIIQRVLEGNGTIRGQASLDFGTWTFDDNTLTASVKFFLDLQDGVRHRLRGPVFIWNAGLVLENAFTVAIANQGGGAGSDVHVTYPVAWDAASPIPQVSVSPQDGATAAMIARAYNRTRTGCTVSLYNAGVIAADVAAFGYPVAIKTP